MSEILITICARGGSKGIPGKNIKELNGIPLIGYTINTAQKFSDMFDADITLSTENDKIKEIANNYGLFTDYVRPAILATDTIGKIDVIKDVLNFEENKRAKRYDIILDLDITSPLRNIKDLIGAFNELKERDDAINIFSVSPAKRNPYFNMVEKNENGFVSLVKNVGNIKSRQTAPKVYDLNASFYFFKRIFFDEAYQIGITDKSLAYLVPHVCFDLDEPEDFIIMDVMFREKLIDFEL